ncbi:hypothetical protein GW17_00049804, partial [Ensete ventricosum]
YHSGGSIAPVWVREATWGCELGCWVSAERSCGIIHDMVQPISVRAAQRGAEPRDDAWGRLDLGCHDGRDLPPCRVAALLQEKTFTWGGSPLTRSLRRLC